MSIKHHQKAKYHNKRNSCAWERHLVKNPNNSQENTSGWKLSSVFNDFGKNTWEVGLDSGSVVSMGLVSDLCFSARSKVILSTFCPLFGFCLIWFLYSKLIFRVQHIDRQQLWDNWKLNTCRVSLSKKAEYVSDYVRGMLKKPLVLLHVTIFFQTSKLSLLSLFFLIIFHVNSWHRSFL